MNAQKILNVSISLWLFLANTIFISGDFILKEAKRSYEKIAALNDIVHNSLIQYSYQNYGVSSSRTMQISAQRVTAAGTLIPARMDNYKSVLYRKNIEHSIDGIKYTYQTMVLNHTGGKCTNIIIPLAKRYMLYGRNNVPQLKFNIFLRHVDRIYNLEKQIALKHTKLSNFKCRWHPALLKVMFVII